MPARYYSALPIQSEQIVLEGDEAHHLLHVMRVQPGNAVVLIDGSGWEFDAEVTACQRRSVELTLVARHEVDRELPKRIVIGVALPKGDRQKWLVEKLTELGVAELIPLQTERGVAQPNIAAVERLKRTVIEASKQCGRTRLMLIAPPQVFADFIHSASRTAIRLIAHPTGQKLDPLAISAEQSVFCGVGPEGGFSDTELEIAANAGWNAISLGSRILRIETAAMALAARLS